MKSIKLNLLAPIALLGLGLTTFGATSVHAAEVKVESGDTLSKIAETHKTSVADLVHINGIENENLIFVGETLFTTSDEAKAAGVKQAATVSAPVVQAEAPAPVVEAPAASVVEAPAPVQAAPSPAAPAGDDNWHRANRRMVESTNNYNIGSANGYIGAYQFAPSTWAAMAGQIGADPNDYSAANQDRIADRYAEVTYGGWSNVPTTGGW